MNDSGDKSAIRLRPTTINDYACIVDVWSASGLSVRPAGREAEHAFRKQLGVFGDLYLVAVDGKCVVGVVLGTHDHRKGWINRVAVLPEYQGRGVAGLLVAACDAALRAQGIEIVAALIEPENTASCRLFEKLGYQTDVEVRYFRKLSRSDA